MSIEMTISIFSLLVSIGTLTLGFYAYRKFLSKQIKQKQLEVICNLVEEIQNEPNNYFFNNPGKSSNSHWYTLIDIAEISELDKYYDKLFLFGKDAVDTEEVLYWQFFLKYYSNPLLPKKIADKLKPFNITHWQTIKFSTIQNEKCVLIGRKKSFDFETPCFFISDSQIRTVKGFRKAASELKSSIQDWLNSYGIKDLNITTSQYFKNE
ncbi:MAG: hypothetical protein WC780_04575 [Lentimicrobiaceae bacterium]|jgi:hypothetical protein